MWTSVSPALFVEDVISLQPAFGIFIQYDVAAVVTPVFGLLRGSACLFRCQCRIVFIPSAVICLEVWDGEFFSVALLAQDYLGYLGSFLVLFERNMGYLFLKKSCGDFNWDHIESVYGF